MVDLYLQAMMRGEIAPKPRINNANSPPDESDKPTAKTPFDLAIEKEIEAYLDTQNFNEGDPRANMLSSPAMKRARMKAELSEALKMKEYTQQIQTALQTIHSEGNKYLETESYNLVIKELRTAEELLDKLDPYKETSEDFQQILQISDETMEAIAKIALGKFDESQYADCFALFTMLALLYPSNPDYWFRAGIAAQSLNDYDSALKNYGNATTLDSDLIPAFLFAAECYHYKGMNEEALNQRNTAKEKMDALPDDANAWRELLENIDAIIK